MADTRRKPHYLKFAVWNANGLLQHRQELSDFLYTHNIDAILIAETHLKAADRPRFPNYDLHRTDRLHGRAGGSGILVKRDLLHHRLDLPPLNTIEATAITIETASVGSLKIVAAYNPPQSRITEADVDDIFNDNVPTLLGGDLNAKHRSWNSRVANTNGQVLFRASLTRDIHVHGPDVPTHYPPNGCRPDVLDILITRRVNALLEMTVLQELNSDHNPIIVQLGAPEDPPLKTIKRVNWPLYLAHIPSLLPPVHTIRNEEDTDAAVDTLTDAIKKAVSASTSTREVFATDPLLLPPWIRDLIRDKNRARRQWQRRRDPWLRTHMNSLQNRVKEAILDHRNRLWEERLSSLSTEDSSIWRMQRTLKNRLNGPCLRALHGRNGMAHTDQEKAEALADGLESQCIASWANIDPDDVARLHRDVRNRLRPQPTSAVLHTTPGEVIKLLANIQTKKAPGHDGVSGMALRLLPRKGVAHLVAIFNAAIRLRYFPASWKIAEVVHIPKEGKNLTFPQNYRPISLLPIMGKLLEKIILARLLQETEKLDLIPHSQFGFRAGHSTTQQALRVVEQITKGFNRKHKTGAFFLDISKAFDSVWHQGLLCKMLDAGISQPMVQIIRSFLKKRKFRSKVRGSLSNPRPMEAGVPQGSVLSPLLFNIFMYDIPLEAGTLLAQYADDTAVLVSCRSTNYISVKLQKAANRLDRYYNQWRIEVNPTKSAAVLFQPGRSPPPRTITMSGQPIPWTNQAKYLGLVLDTRLTWAKHIKYVSGKTSAAIAALYPLIGRNSKLTIDNKLLIYKTCICPIMLYASPVWSYAATTHIKRLQAIQNKSLRAIADAPWFARNRQIHRELGIAPITDQLVAAATRLAAQLAAHPNPEISGIWDYDPEEDGRRHKRPKHILSAL